VERLEDRTLLSSQAVGGLALPPGAASPLELTSLRESEPNDTLATANAISLNSNVTGTVASPRDQDFFKVTVSDLGHLTARLHAEGFTARLSLLDSAGTELIQSDGESLTNPDGRIDQYLEGSAGGATYFLEVQGLGSSTGNYELKTDFVTSSPPFQPVPVNGRLPQQIVSGDFNGDGIPDLAVVNSATNDMSVLLGVGDDTFRTPVNYAVGSFPLAAVVGDFTGDGHLDLAVADQGSNDVAVLLGVGDGSFRAPMFYPVGKGPHALVAGDFTGDGHLDLAVANDVSNDVSVLLGRGDGTFQNQVRYPVGDAPLSLVAGDFAGDGTLDLATANNISNDLSVLRGVGDGTFRNQVRYAAGAGPFALAAADLRNNGRLDLLTANYLSNDVSILLGKGDGTFQPPTRYDVGSNPVALVVGDFRGCPVPDLAVANSISNDISLLPGVGDGSFGSQARYPVGASPASLVATDLNGDGRLDLAVVNSQSDDISVLPGLGDGTFQQPARTEVGGHPNALVAADFNSDGFSDLASADETTRTVSVLLGGGEGTFQKPVPYPAGILPTSLAVADLNGDGRPDLAVTDAGSNTVLVMLGVGDGTFEKAVRYTVGRNPVAVAVADFNGDGVPDLAVVDQGSSDVAVLQCIGDGTFRSAVRYSVGISPSAIAVGDWNGVPFLAVTDAGSNDVAVLPGLGDGTFGPAVRYAVGANPSAIAVGDWNGVPFLAVAEAGSNDVAVLRGLENRTFQKPVYYQVGANPEAVTVGDFDGDGVPDLAVADHGSNNVALLPGARDGTFQAPVYYPVGAAPRALVAADFNGDGHLDLATANDVSNDVSILLGRGDGTFVDAGTISNPIRSTPLIADLSGATDVVVITQAGNILYRKGRPKEPGSFDPPIVINPGRPARDVAIVAGPQGKRVAALDAQGDTASLYSLQPDGSFAATATLQAGLLPSRIVTGDLNADGRDDLVVLNAGAGSLSVFLQNADGTFSSRGEIPVSIGASDLALADVDGDGSPDLLVTNQVTGDLTVLLNQGNGAFVPSGRFRAGAGPFDIKDLNGSPAVASLEGTDGLAAGAFTGDGATDVVAVNRAANTFSLLRGIGSASFLNPQIFPTGSHPAAIRVGDLTADGHADAVVLEDSRVEVFLGDGVGGFKRMPPIDAGAAPTGLTIADINGDGIPDLVVGNALGDVLILYGNGDGTFRPYQRVDHRVSLAVVKDTNHAGQDDVIVADPSLDRVFVANGPAGQAFAQDRADGLLAPSAVRVADLNGDGIPDLVVANSGGNNVLVYLGDGHGSFGPALSFPVGTNPVAVTISDLTGDGVPDLIVANEGSNDVSILFGQGRGSSWTLTPGPRLRTGVGPVSAMIEDVTGPRGVPDGIPDLVVSNSQSDNVYVLPGVGNGFFDDRHPLILPLLTSPGALVPLRTEPSGGGILIPGRDAIDLFRSFTPTSASTEFPTGGTDPVAAVAADINGSGFEDLIVANNADGRITLLPGDPTGFGSAETLPLDTLRPTDLALSASGSMLLYVGQENGSVASFDLLGFRPGAPNPSAEPGASVEGPAGEEVANVSGGIPNGTLGGGIPLDLLPPGPPAESTRPPEEQRTQVTVPLPLREATVAFVATLVTGAGEGGDTTAGNAALAGGDTGRGPAPGSTAINSGGDGDEPRLLDTIAPAANASGTPAKLLDFLSGATRDVTGDLPTGREASEAEPASGPVPATPAPEGREGMGNDRHSFPDSSFHDRDEAFSTAWPRERDCENHPHVLPGDESGSPAWIAWLAFAGEFPSQPWCAARGTAPNGQWLPANALEQADGFAGFGAAALLASILCRIHQAELAGLNRAPTRKRPLARGDQHG
jgi:hypothetical protein